MSPEDVNGQLKLKLKLIVDVKVGHKKWQEQRSLLLPLNAEALQDSDERYQYILREIKQAMQEEYPAAESHRVFLDETKGDDLATDVMTELAQAQDSNAECAVHGEVVLPARVEKSSFVIKLRRGSSMDSMQDCEVEPISSGAFGAVYKDIGSNVALKAALGEEQCDELEKEILLLQELRGIDHVIQLRERAEVTFLGACGKRSVPGFVMELGLHSASDLRKQPETWADATFFMQKDIASALHYLHTEKKIVHMDIKPANIILTHQWPRDEGDKLPPFVKNGMTLKIADFGAAGHLGECVGAVTKGFLHAEIEEMRLRNLEGLKVHRKYDFYALGICMFAKPPLNCRWSWLERPNWSWWYCKEAKEYAHLIYQAVRDEGDCDWLVVAAADSILGEAVWAPEDKEILPPTKEAHANDGRVFEWRMTRDQRTGRFNMAFNTYMQTGELPKLDQLFDQPPLDKDGFSFFRVHASTWAEKYGLDHRALASAAILHMLRDESMGVLERDLQTFDQRIRPFTAARLGRLERATFLDETTLRRLKGLKDSLLCKRSELAVWLMDQLLGIFCGDWAQTGRSDAESNNPLDDPIKRAFAELTQCTTLLVQPANNFLMHVLTADEVVEGYVQCVPQMSYQFPAAIMVHLDRASGRDMFESYDAQIGFLNSFIDKAVVQETWDDGAAAVRQLLEANPNVHLASTGYATPAHYCTVINSVMELCCRPEACEVQGHSAHRRSTDHSVQLQERSGRVCADTLACSSWRLTTRYFCHGSSIVPLQSLAASITHRRCCRFLCMPSLGLGFFSVPNCGSLAQFHEEAFLKTE